MLEVTEAIKNSVNSIKPFLVKLYRAESRYKKNKVLRAASDHELSTLIKVLHFMANQEISFSKSKEKILIKSRRLPYIVEHFKTDKSVNLLLGSSRSQQLSILVRAGLFVHLLHAMFYEE
jgi:hypothetical protein